MTAPPPRALAVALSAFDPDGRRLDDADLALAAARIAELKKTSGGSGGAGCVGGYGTRPAWTLLGTEAASDPAALAAVAAALEGDVLTLVRPRRIDAAALADALSGFPGRVHVALPADPHRDRADDVAAELRGLEERGLGAYIEIAAGRALLEEMPPAAFAAWLESFGPPPVLHVARDLGAPDAPGADALDAWLSAVLGHARAAGAVPPLAGLSELALAAEEQDGAAAEPGSLSPADLLPIIETRLATTLHIDGDLALRLWLRGAGHRPLGGADVPPALGDLRRESAPEILARAGLRRLAMEGLRRFLIDARCARCPLASHCAAGQADLLRRLAPDSGPACHGLLGAVGALRRDPAGLAAAAARFRSAGL